MTEEQKFWFNVWLTIALAFGMAGFTNLPRGGWASLLGVILILIGLGSGAKALHIRQSPDAVDLNTTEIN